VLSVSAREEKMRSTNKTNSFNSELELIGRGRDGAERTAGDVSHREGNRKIDFILVYTKTSESDKIETREIYETNLENRNLQLKHVPSITVGN
jgi:hypothetical protein